MTSSEKPSIFAERSFQLDAPSTMKRLIWGILGLGVFLRSWQYFLDRSLWIDEAFIALNLIERSLPELLQPLSYRQGAPFGFLALEKLALIGLGTSEWVLRLVPFLAGIVSLWLFRAVALRFANVTTAVMAMALFAFCDRLIYFAAETKQYSTDVAITLLLYIVLIHPSAQTSTPQLTWLRCGWMAFIGGVSLWFSHPAIFVLAGVGLTLAAQAISRKHWQQVWQYLLIFAAWLMSFIAFYFISLRSLTNNEALQNSFDGNHNAFMPLIPTSIQDVNWFIENFFAFFDSPLSLPAQGLAALCFVIGVYAIGHKDKFKLSFLLAPVGMTLLASGLHQYPFKARLLLFMVPLVFLILAEGIGYLFSCLQANQRWIGFVVLLLLLFHPVYYAFGNLKNPAFITHDSSYQRIRENIKPVLTYVQANRQPEDSVYLYYAAQYAFKYYADNDPEQFNFNDLMTGKVVWPEDSGAWFEPALPSYPPTLIVGRYSRDDWSVFAHEINTLRGRSRVWFVFAHVRDRRSSIDEEDVYRHLLDRAGVQLDAIDDVEASAYLYDLAAL